MSITASARQRDPVVAVSTATPSPRVSLGYWIFRNRTWLPIPLGILLIVLKPGVLETRVLWVGAACILAGEAIRLWAVRHIGGVSRTRTTKIGPLVMSGPYAYTRNPLYVGNWLLWSGFALGSSLRWMVLLSWTVFAVQHVFVVQWEEHLLAQHYPHAYPRYATIVPRWWPWPRRSHVAPAPKLHPWNEVLFSERGTLAAIVSVAVLLIARRLLG